MSQFFTNENVSLEKEVDSQINGALSKDLIDETYELPKCVDWITTHAFQKVCLQFPDHLLPDSSEVSLRLRKALKRDVYILADTAYESCCIDFVAAAHINADAIIHFGPTCFSNCSANIPYLFIYEKTDLNLDTLYEQFSHKLNNSDEQIIILLDTSFIHLTEKVAAKFQNTVIKTINCDLTDLENSTVLFIGGRNQTRKIPNLKFSYKIKTLYFFNENGIVNYEEDVKILRRRYFLAEKIKDSNTVGIIVGTLAVKNYLNVIDRLKTLCTLHKKKFYLLSVGKPTVAKLANFPEIDIYVMVTCALNEIYDSREYYKPIVTIYDVEMALNSNENPLNFTYDYNAVLSRQISDVISDSDVSLISGSIRGGANVSSGRELIAKEAGTIAMNTNYGAGFLGARTWKGLERHIGEGEVTLAQEGSFGIAQKYSTETS